MGEATAHYEQREAELGAERMREIERQVMLRIIDHDWREHLYEMDYLQEGINLRAMGQKDPLVEWQREGFEMFGEMMQTRRQDFVKYVMHVQVVVAARPSSRRSATCQHSGPGGSVRGSGTGDGRSCRRRRGRPLPAGGAAEAEAEPLAQTAGGEDRVGQDAAQRAVPVRERQEVQALPRRLKRGT